MRLDSLRVRDYRLLRRASVRFPMGIIGIVGGNGDGKSTLLEAIMFALWGSEAIDGNNEDLLHKKGGDPEDWLEFSLGDDHYLVHRRIRRKGATAEAQLFCNGKQIADGTTPTNLALVERLGSLKKASVSRFVAQDDLNAISVLKPADRKRLILHLLGIDAVEIAVANLRRAVLDFDRSIKAYRQSLPDLAAITAELAALSARSRSLAVERKAATAATVAAEARLAAAEAVVAGHEAGAEATAHQSATLGLVKQSLADIAAREANLDADETRLAEVAVRLAAAETTREQAESHRDEYLAQEAAATLRRKIPELEIQQVALASAIAADTRELARLRALSLTEAALLRQETSLAEDIAQAAAALAVAENERTAELRALARNREEQKAHQADLDLADPAGGQCRSCGQAIEPAAYRAHLEAALAAAQAEEANIIARGSAARSRILALGQSRAQAEKEREQVGAKIRAASAAAAELRLLEVAAAGRIQQATEGQNEMAEAAAVPYDEVRHGELADETASLSGLDSVMAGYRAELGQRERIAVERRSINERKADLLSQQNAAVESLVAAGYDQEAHAAAEAAAQVASEALTLARLEETRLKGEADRLEDALARNRLDASKHRQSQAEIDRLLGERRDHELTRQVMDHFKVVLIGRIRPLLSRKASTLLRELTEGRYSELLLDANYEMEFGLPGEVFPIRRASGGERNLMNLCLRLAISELINESTGVGQNFLILDEVLGSQDDERREAIVTSLPRLSSHFGQVLMIAHSREVQDLFEHVVFVRYDRNSKLSTVRFPESDPEEPELDEPDPGEPGIAV